jgi:hypothetical protein
LDEESYPAVKGRMVTNRIPEGYTKMTTVSMVKHPEKSRAVFTETTTGILNAMYTRNVNQ